MSKEKWCFILKKLKSFGYVSENTVFISSLFQARNWNAGSGIYEKKIEQ